MSTSKKLSSGSCLLWMAAPTTISLVLVVYYGLADKADVFIMANAMTIAMVEHFKALWSSLGLSPISTIICLLLTCLLAITPRNRGIGKDSFVVFISIPPVWMGSLFRTLAWRTLLKKGGAINGILTTLHLSDQPLANTLGAIILGMVYSSLPFAVLPIYNVLCKIDGNTIDVTHDSDANSMQVPVCIWIPLSLPDTTGSIAMVFIPTPTTFVIPNSLGGSKILLIGNVIEQELTKGDNWYPGSSLSLVLMVSILVSMTFIAKCDR